MSDFEITQRLQEGEGALYRAVRRPGGQPVLLKTYRSPRLPLRDLQRLRHELAIARELALAAVRPIALESFRDQPALVLEDFGGEPLDRLTGGPLPPVRFLPIAIATARALAAVHEHNVIHKDIKPENILLDPRTGEVKLTGFGIASRLPAEHQAVQNPSLIEGTLAYMSPEQSGRMNRSIDDRTDLYSLGVTYYQLLTGQLPFSANDPMEWVHCHLARTPRPPLALCPDVPAPLSDIVMKLLAKGAEDRYQSARGLQHDLEICRDRLVATGHIDPFPLATHDVSERFHIPQKLYGRDREVAALLDTFASIVEPGPPALILIAGYSGIGKSSLVHELHRPIVATRGLFGAGKFDQYRRGIPYATITQAFRDLVRQILTEPEAEIARWREHLTAALGKNARLIADVIPEIELILGPTPPVLDLGPGETQNRFNLAIIAFIGVFATARHPLALLLDDMQWADGATLQLIETLLTQGAVGHLLIILAYRDNEIDAAHPLSITIDRLRAAGVSPRRITLGPLALPEITRLVADTLHCEAARAAPLARLVVRKTQGNPFFVNEFLKTLHREHLLELDHQSRQWRWDEARIEAQGITDNLVHLLIERMARLGEETQEALKLASCIGNVFELNILARIHERGEAETLQLLGEALHEGLLLPVGDTHRIAAELEPDEIAGLRISYRFQHDRIQQAAHALIPPDKRSEVHLRIGRLLLSTLTEQEREERLFDIVHQLDLGIDLIAEPEEREAIARLNLQAGRKAKTSTAYVPARGYFETAARLLPPDAWARAYPLARDVSVEYAECRYLCGDFAEAEALFVEVTERAATPLEKARIATLRLKLYQVAGKYDEGVTLALAALELFGVTLPSEPAALDATMQAEAAAIREALRGCDISALADAPLLRDPAIQVVIDLLANAAPCAYIGRPAVFPLISLKMLHLSLSHGNTEQSCFAYSVYGLMLIGVWDDIPTAYAFSEMSIRLNERLGDAKLRGTLLHLHGDHINFWKNPIATDFPILDKAFLACIEVGDLVYASYLAFETVWQAVERGDVLEDVFKLSQRYAAFARQSRNEAVFETIRVEQQFLRNLRGLTRGRDTLEDGDFDEARSVSIITRASFGCGVVFHHILRMILHYTYGDYAAALDDARAAEPLLGAAMAMPIVATYAFYLALAAVAVAGQAPPEQRASYDDLLAAQERRFARWAEHCPANFAARLLLLRAERARLDGRDMDALRLYEQGIHAARESGFVHQEALGHELAGQFLLGQGFELIAHAHLRQARNGYLVWGADEKVLQLDERYPGLSEQPGAPEPRPKGSPAAGFVSARVEQLDVFPVLKASQVISSEIVLARLLETLMRTVIEPAGAQRGVLLLAGEHDDLSIEAEVQIGDGERVLVASRPLGDDDDLPHSILHYVRRTRESVILADASAGGPYSRDAYIVRRRPRSLLCMPLLRQATLRGLLYLENHLVPHAFTPERLAVLELIASQATISIDNAILYQRAQEAIQQRDEFLSIASHELRNPIAAMQLQMRVIERGQRHQGSGASSLTVPRDAIALFGRHLERLALLVHQLLDVSRLRVGYLALQREPTDLGDLIKDVASRLAAQVQSAGCTLAIHAADGVIGPWDRSRLEQVAVNLLGNALKYGAGQAVTVRVERAGDRARLIVSDAGMGIAKADQARIFQRFERAVSARHYGGLGLGLYIVHQIVEAHGGTIRVESEPGQGATFTVELPLEPPADPRTPTTAAPR
ncbi:MAG TPA: AAA family ATPase [Polyangia bacterium]|jgi:predicted ATPase/signal transduction histidine kinase/tRNA A-37 threonylcarbamoyl transferase component Bud32|nr:AAA family ATPase [Polyangia bacterium]